MAVKTQSSIVSASWRYLKRKKVLKKQQTHKFHRIDFYSVKIYDMMCARYSQRVFFCEEFYHALLEKIDSDSWPGKLDLFVNIWRRKSKLSGIRSRRCLSTLLGKFVYVTWINIFVTLTLLIYTLSFLSFCVLVLDWFVFDCRILYIFINLVGRCQFEGYEMKLILFLLLFDTHCDSYSQVAKSQQVLVYVSVK